MEDNTTLIETLLEQTAKYGKTNLELLKLRAVDKTSEGISNFLPPAVITIVMGTFMLFINLGFALWLGEILGRIFFGFFVVAAFYALIALILHFLMRKWLKRIFYDYIISILCR